MRLCIVDDDVQLSEALKLQLQQKGYAVDCFTDSVKGLNHLRTNHIDYDIIIVDWMMPDITGLEICTRLRSNGVATPILMLTAVDNVDNKVTALDVGADDYLTKPFMMTELFARIRALGRRPKEAKPTILTTGEISLNTSNHQVTVQSKDIQLTLKEFRILEYLMLHAGQVVGRDMILDNVWDMGFVSFSNIIDVRINGLRKKLGPTGERCIKTIRGVGYKLEATKATGVKSLM